MLSIMAAQTICLMLEPQLSYARNTCIYPPQRILGRQEIRDKGRTTLILLIVMDETDLKSKDNKSTTNN